MAHRLSGGMTLYLKVGGSGRRSGAGFQGHIGLALVGCLKLKRL